MISLPTAKNTLATCLITVVLATSTVYGAPRQDLTVERLNAGDTALKAGQSAVAIEDYSSAYDASIGDINLTASQQVTLATNYSWALLQQPEKNRPKMLAFAEKLLLDRTTPPAIRSVALAVAGKLLNRDLGAPKGDIEEFCENIAAQLTSPVQPWNTGVQGAFIMSMAAQSNGRIWIGTEDNGLWLYDPLAGAWKQFTTKDGLGDDDIYAICTDKLQRIWVGHLNHGVSVFNGQKWQNYDPLSGGPRGERVFSLAVSPLDGDVWMASSAGLCRYGVSKDIWTYYDRSTGLPSDQAQAIVFDKRGTLYVGTDCDGIAIGTPRDNYATWRRVTGPTLIPNAPEGVGIPSNQINCLLADSRGTIWAGTPCGLAHSSDSGVQWTFKRGRDWRDKVAGQWQSPEVSGMTAKDLLAEDYVSCLTENADGLIYIGYRADNFEVRDPVSGQKIFPSTGETVPSLYLSSLLPVDKGYVLLGRYGDGVQQELPFGVTAAHGVTTNDAHATDVSIARPATFPSLPTPLKPLQQPAQVSALAAALNTKAPKMRPGDAYYEGPDWVTEGDYEGHYGTGYAVLCSAQAPLDNEIWGDYSYHVTGKIGPHADAGDGLRHWIHWLTTDSQKCLWDPALGHRRQAEWDDHGE